MEEVLKEILQEMCKRVNANYDEINFQEDNWYHKYSWTLEEENEFKKWLINYFNNNKSAFKVMCKFPSITKIEKLVDEFIFQYGWKLKDPNL